MTGIDIPAGTNRRKQRNHWRAVCVLAVSGAALAATTGNTSSSAPAELHIPAFTAYLLPDADAARISANRPVLPFSSPGTRLAWYGLFRERGTFSASVNLRVPSGEAHDVRLAVGNTIRTATVRGRAGESRAEFGDFTVADTGYVKLELSVADGSAAPALEVVALALDGAAAQRAHFNTEPRRNAASVHLRFPTDSSALITGFYNEVTAIDDPVASYYMATGFARGYFGMQVNSPTERRIIFSVWDAANGTNAVDRSTVAAENFTQLVAKGPSVVAEVFGNEGTGGHSHLVYQWKTGSTQRFFVTALPEGTFTVYTGYWFHPERHEWMLIASFRAPKDGEGLRRLYSFSENFGGSNGHLRRKALYGSQWVRYADRSWHELTTATFTHDPTGREARLDRLAGVEDGKFFLSHGGFVPGFAESGSAFARAATSSPPRDVPDR